MFFVQSTWNAHFYKFWMIFMIEKVEERAKGPPFEIFRHYATF